MNSGSVMGNSSDWRQPRGRGGKTTRLEMSCKGKEASQRLIGTCIFGGGGWWASRGRPKWWGGEAFAITVIYF